MTLLETLSDAELTTLEDLLLLPLALTALTLLPTEELFAEITVMLIAPWEELDATLPTTILFLDLPIYGILETLDATRSALPSTFKDPSELIKDKTPLPADCTTPKSLLELELWFTALTLPKTETSFAEMIPA